MKTLTKFAFVAALLGLVGITFTGNRAEASPLDCVVEIPATLSLRAHYRVGPYTVESFNGPWQFEAVGNTRVARPQCSQATVSVRVEDGELRVHKMTKKGEVVEGEDWLSVRPGMERGAGSQVPWTEEWSSFAAFTLCTGTTVTEFPRSELDSISFKGPCWVANGGTHTCEATANDDCGVDWTQDGEVAESASGECGDGPTVQFHTINGVPMVRICED